MAGKIQSVQLLDKRHATIPRALLFEVARVRLKNRLNQNPYCYIHALAAPSGYGKTTFVAQSLRGSNAPVAWLEAISDDADVLHFARSLHRAMEQVLPQAQTNTFAQLLETSTIPQALSVALKRELRIWGALEIVIDNTEHLGPEARAWLSDLLETNTGTRWWLIGYDLEHFRLARLTAKSAAVILTQDDLRFDLEETQRVLKEHSSSEDAQNTWSKLDGWPAGVSLVANGVSSQITPTNLIFDAISQLPLPLRKRLPESAVLEVWSESAASELGCDLPDGWLFDVRRAGLPLTQLGPDTFRPHRTLLEALEQQLRAHPEKHQSLHARAANQSLQRHEFIGAIRHFLAAADHQGAIHAATPLVLDLSARGEHGLIRHILTEIGAPLPAHLAGLLALALLDSGAIESSQFLLDELHQNGNMSPSSLFALGKIALRAGHPEQTLEYARQGQSFTDASPLELGRCRRLEGWALVNLKRLEEALNRAELEVARAEADQNLKDLAAALFLAAYVYTETHQFERVEQSLQRAIAVNEELGNISDAASVRNQLANHYRLTGQFALAFKQLQDAIGDVETLEAEVLPYLYDTLGEVQIRQQQPTQAATSFRKAISAAKRLGHHNAVPGIQLRLVETLLQTTEASTAPTLFYVIEIPPSETALSEFVRALLVFQNDPAQALNHLQIALPQLDSEYTIRAHVLMAELHRRQTDLRHQDVHTLVTLLEKTISTEAVFIDAHLTQPTLEHMAVSGWLPMKLAKRIVDLDKIHSKRIRVQVQTLGQRRVLINDEPVQVRLAKSFEVLVYLLLHGPSNREAILDAIWDEDTPQSQRYFKVAVRRLRSDLSQHPLIDFDVVMFDTQYIIAAQLETTLDLKALETAVAHNDYPTLQVALNQIKGEFLPGATTAWSEEHRLQVTQTRLLGAVKLGHFLMQAEPKQAATYFQQALTLEPFNDDYLIDLITALISIDDTITAKLVVNQYRQNLQRELNVDFSATTKQKLEALGFEPQIDSPRILR